MKRKNRSQSTKIIHTYGVDMPLQPLESPHHPSIPTDMSSSIAAVELILNYTFKNKSLLEEALTHSSYTGAPSYQRLEFLGDSVIGLAISAFFFVTYPDVDAGQLTLLRAPNVSTERLARVAVQHGLYKYIRHNKANVLSDKVREFLGAVTEEKKKVVHGGQMKPPKVLADIVESIAAAVFVDSGFNLETVWRIFRRLLEPLVLLNDVLAQPQPVTALHEACHKDGKCIDIRHERNGERNIASVFVDGKYIASGSSETKENAKLHAAKAALSKLTTSKSGDTLLQPIVEFNESVEIEGAKQKVSELCNKKRWPKPTYRLEQELGPAHDKRYVSSIQVETSHNILFVKGNERSKVKDAQNSAASLMFSALLKNGYA